MRNGVSVVLGSREIPLAVLFGELPKCPDLTAVNLKNGFVILLKDESSFQRDAVPENL